MYVQAMGPYCPHIHYVCSHTAKLPDRQLEGEWFVLAHVSQGSQPVRREAGGGVMLMFMVVKGGVAHILVNQDTESTWLEPGSCGTSMSLTQLTYFHQPGSTS